MPFREIAGYPPEAQGTPEPRGTRIEDPGAAHAEAKLVNKEVEARITEILLEIARAIAKNESLGSPGGHVPLKNLISRDELDALANRLGTPYICVDIRRRVEGGTLNKDARYEAFSGDRTNDLELPITELGIQGIIILRTIESELPNAASTSLISLTRQQWQENQSLAIEPIPLKNPSNYDNRMGRGKNLQG